MKRFRQGFQPFHQGQRQFQQGTALVGQGNARAMALKQPAAQVLFQ